MQQTFLNYGDARRQIKTGGLLLFHPRDWWSEPIAWGTESELSHGAMACHCLDRILALQMTAWEDGKPLLSTLVKRYPGCIRYYDIDLLYDSEEFRQAAARRMLELTDMPYGWRSLLYAALREIGLRKTETDDAFKAGYPPNCTHALAIAYHEASPNGDPVAEKADCAVTPADLSHSLLFDYRFTLLPDNIDRAAFTAQWAKER